MKPEIAQQLKAHLDTREQQKRDAEVRISEQEKAQAKNLADFAAKKDGVIRPAFQEIVDIYQARALPVRIAEHDERANSTGGTENPAIYLDMAGPDSYNQTLKPQFKLTFDKRLRTLALYTSTRSQAGPGPSVSLDDISADWVHTEFLKYEGIPVVNIGAVKFGKIVSR